MYNELYTEEERISLILESIIDIIPQFIKRIDEDDDAYHFKKINKIGLKYNNDSYWIWYHQIDKDLNEIITYIDNEFERWCDSHQTAFFTEQVQMDILLKWFEIIHKGNNVDWKNILEFLSDVANTENEHHTVKLNIVIASSTNEQENIDRINKHTLFLKDFLATFNKLSNSNEVYFYVNSNLEILNLLELKTNLPEVKYTGLPSEISRYPSLIKYNDDVLSIHILKNKEIVLANKSGIIASKRQGKWRIYEIQSLKEIFADTFRALSINKSENANHRRLGRQMFDIVMLLSYRRKGSLVVLYKESLADYILENISYVERNNFNSLATLKFDYLDRNNKPIRNQEIFMDAACQDGALICDGNGVIASNIFMYNITSNFKYKATGARALAVEMLTKLSKVPIILQISSNGEIKLHMTYHKERLALSFR